VNPGIRVVQASSSEMFGGGQGLTENTMLRPRSPYGVAKAFAHHTVVNYRESHGLHCSAAIMFNHESPRRGPEFVTRKVSLAAAAIAHGTQSALRLGRMDTKRDWGWAPDYMQALPLIAARDEPGDYVLATGDVYSVADLVKMAFFHAGIDNWADYVAQDDSLFRPADVDYLQGDARKAWSLLRWQPSVRFPEIVKRMVEHDMDVYDPRSEQ
jgi:GDPmannose 4,6-dehydratase